MRAMLSSLMSLTLVFHAALGCCWHHDHRCEHDGEFDTQTCESDACCEHYEDQGDPAESTPPCDCKLECHGICTYVAPQKVQLDVPLAVAPFDSIAIRSLVVDAHLALGLPGDSADPAEFEPPLRLHLLHSIVLI